MPFVPEVHFVYTVRPGDTLYALSERFPTDVDSLRRANAIYPPFTEPDLIYPGQKLLIPTYQYAITPVQYIVQPGEALYQIALNFSTDPDLIAGISGVQEPAFIYPNQVLQIPAFVYLIEPGDALYRIAEETGVKLADIVRANTERSFFSPDTIYPGYKILIPAPTSQNIYVNRPLPGERVQEGFQLSGFARAFEANVNFQVRDANGVIVTEEKYTTAEIAAPTYAPFEVSVPFDRRPTTDTGELWVYTRSARDGSIQDLVQVKIYFS